MLCSGLFSPPTKHSDMQPHRTLNRVPCRNPNHTDILESKCVRFDFDQPHHANTVAQSCSGKAWRFSYSEASTPVRMIADPMIICRNNHHWSFITASLGLFSSCSVCLLGASLELYNKYTTVIGPTPPGIGVDDQRHGDENDMSWLPRTTHPKHLGNVCPIETTS